MKMLEIEKKFEGINDIMTKLRIEQNLCEEEKKVLVRFIDTFVTCSITNDCVKDIVQEVQVHNHSKTCYKRDKNCRFGYPKFPSAKTIVSQPLRKQDFPSKNQYKKILARNKKILEKVK